MKNKYESNNNLNPIDMPGNISIISKDNPVHGPSLVQDIWEFQHDPDDLYIWDFIKSKEENLVKRHSYQQIKDKGNFLYKNEQNGNNDKYYCHSEVNGQEERNQYGLRAILNGQNAKKYIDQRGQRDKSDKGLLQLNCIQDRRGSKSPYQQNEDSRRILEGPIRQKKQLTSSPDFSSYNRDIQILQRKNISNLNYILRQTKQIAYLTKFHIIQIERQQMKKAVIKLQIQCRKLRISLRSSSASIIRLHPLKKKEYLISPKNNNNVESRQKSVCSEKQKLLSERIISEKKKTNNLATKTSLLSNYYNVIKGKKVDDFLCEQSDTCQDTFGKKQRPVSPNRKISSWVHDNYELKKYKNLLQNKMSIIKESMEETKLEISQRYLRRQQENNLLRKQLQFLNSQITKTQENILEYRDKDNLKSGFFRRKVNQPTLHTKSKRKLVCEDSVQGQEVHSKQKKLKSLSRIRSQHLFTNKSKNKNTKYKQIKGNENNQYFLNVDSYKFM